MNIAVIMWFAWINDWTDPIHHNHIYNQSIGIYYTEAECKKDLPNLLDRIVVGIKAPPSVLTCKAMDY